MKQWIISYAGFLQNVERTFPTKERAQQWCRQIGRADLIPQIHALGSKERTR